MKRLAVFSSILVIPLVAFGTKGPLRATAEHSRVERGRHLVKSIGSGDCHAPKKMGPNGPVEDESRFLSGHPEGSELPAPPRLGRGPWMAAASWDLTARSGPWGISYAMNLTPDENTGIGSWSEETFVKALRTGRHMGASRPILPPFPGWPSATSPMRTSGRSTPT